MTKSDLLEKLRNEEETLVLELLNISSEEIVDAFIDKIDERFKTIYAFYEEEQ